MQEENHPSVVSRIVKLIIILLIVSFIVFLIYYDTTREQQIKDNLSAVKEKWAEKEVSER